MKFILACVAVFFALAGVAHAERTRTPLLRGIDYQRERAQDCRFELDHVEWPVAGLERRTQSRALRRWILHRWQRRAQSTCTIVRHLNAYTPRAIVYVFGRIGESSEALHVASGESGRGDIWRHPYCTKAANGQYRGCFQMGETERATYGFGRTPLAQTWAAFRMFVAGGRSWCPWAQTSTRC